MTSSHAFKVDTRATSRALPLNMLEVQLRVARHAMRLVGPLGVADREPWLATRAGIIRAEIRRRLRPTT